ncbi:MAG: tetratricopeptide repeat protein [Fimbriimonadales bacterium]|nr:tetratricopeptide repeat protein [Fimbriimonadales bacterium]MDW8050982.1 tetratricopeptide repeat protein [Armatimonadota bacterium]
MPRSIAWLGTLGVLVIVGVLYAPTLDFKFVWDDNQVIYGRVDYRAPARWLEAVRQPLDFSPNYWRPLALSSLLVQLWVWGDNPAPFHAVNMLLHLLNTALVCTLGLRLAQGHWLGVLLGGLYGVHPALVESVAFVSARYDLMVTLFLLLALWLERRLGGIARIVSVSSAFALALLCKELAIVFPLVLVAWQLAWREGEWHTRLRQLWRAEGGLYAAIGLTLALYLGIRYLTLGYLLTEPPPGVQIDPGTPVQHLLLIGRTLTTLMGLVVFPFFSITPAHHSELPIPLHDGWAWAQLGVAGGILVVLALLVWRVPQAGWLLLAGLISLLPVLNLRPLEFAVGIFTAERFLTFPLALFALGFGQLVLAKRATTELHRRSNAVATQRVRAFALGAAVWGAGAVVTTATILPNWRDAETFWLWLTRASPRSPIGYANLSDLYNKMGRYQEAIPYAEKAIQVAPHCGMGYVNKGVALLHLGNREQATALFRQATQVEPQNVIAWNNLAVMLAERGAYNQAERIIKQRVLGKVPKFLGHQALGLIYSRQARLDLAEQEFQRAYALMTNPHGSVAERALQQLREASKWIVAAHHWMNRGDLTIAERHLQSAATRDPNRVEYAIALARLRLLQNRPTEARRLLYELRTYGYSDSTIEALWAELQRARSRP